MARHAEAWLGLAWQGMGWPGITTQGSMSKQMADTLRKAIAASGVPVLTLSKKCGVPQPRISDFMNGKDIRLKTAQKIADYFGLKLKK